MGQLKATLDNLIALKAEQVRRNSMQRTISDLEAASRGRRRPLSLSTSLAVPGVSLITDLKRQSMGQQAYRTGFEPELLARMCAENGAAAVSVLIDDIYFGGSPKTVEAVASVLGGVIPIIYKEFILDPYQVAEAYALGADAVLIIARPETDPAALGESIKYAHTLGMDAMVEIFALESGYQALAAGARVIGINNRDYPNTTINIERGGQMRAALPSNVPVISESGLKSPDDIRHAGELGFDGVLIGEAILTATDIPTKVRELSEVGRSVSVKKATRVEA
jgi:indole-3-glycerol phosphate synthase